MLTEEQRRDWERDIAYRTAWRENRWVPADRHVVMDDTILAVAAHLTGVEARLAAVTPVVEAARSYICWEYGIDPYIFQEWTDVTAELRELELPPDHPACVLAAAALAAAGEGKEASE